MQKSCVWWNTTDIEGGLLPEWNHSLAEDQGGKSAKSLFDREPITELGVENSSAKIVPANTVTVAMYGDGQTAGRVGLTKIPLTTNQACCNLIIDEDLANPEFVFYLLRGSYDELVARKTGSGQQNLNAQLIKSFEFSAPPVVEQKAIASTLSCLDEKIDLLHRQNKTLEAMAETLFRQWFVEDAQEDWEEKSLLDLIELIGGGTPKTSTPEYWDGDIPWLSGGDIATNHKGVISESAKTITKTGLKNSSAKLLPRFATVISARGTVGKYCLLASEMAFSQSNYGILPRIKGCYFFTYLLMTHVVEELQSAAYGSVFDTITTATFREAKFSTPPAAKVLEFEDFVASYFDKKLVNQTQIHTLEELRDTLLPKLMSGEVRVEV